MRVILRLQFYHICLFIYFPVENCLSRYTVSACCFFFLFTFLSMFASKLLVLQLLVLLWSLFFLFCLVLQSRICFFFSSQSIWTNFRLTQEKSIRELCCSASKRKHYNCIHLINRTKWSQRQNSIENEERNWKKEKKN